MKIITKENVKRVMSFALCVVLAFSLCTPAFAAVDEAELIGTVEAFTDGLSVEGTKDITVTNSEEITLDFSRADASVGRNKDGWWAGIKIIAPEGLTEDELKNATYKRYGTDGWTAPISFWGAKDSKEGDSVHYMGAWMLVTPELIKNDADGKLTLDYEFTWSENFVQNITFTLDITKINLDMSHFNGSVEAFTSGLVAEGSDEILVTNEEEITLSYSKADASIGRWQDGWWAGIKVVAPKDLTEDELKEVKYRKYTAEGWSEPISFWSAKDSKEGDSVHYMGAWMLVTPELIKNDADGKLTLNYEFDWYGNGFESAVQKITFTLDTTKIALDHENYYAEISGITKGLAVEGAGTNTVTVTNADEITLDFSKADMSIGRYMDGWWAGVNILVPAELSEEDVKNVKYRRNEEEGWSADRSFWQYKDSKEGADRHYITVWIPVTPEYIEKDEDGFLTAKYLFDWDNNGFGISAQEITIKLDVNKIKLNMDGYLGSVQALTSGLTVDGEEEITVTNSEEITLDFSRADASVGRNKDGWWAGIKIIAPEGLTEDELKNATYKRYGANGWTDPISFWNAKDSKDTDSVHYMGAWMCVTPDIIKNDADGKLTLKYEFTWGENFVQEITFTLDVTKINLNMNTYLGSVETYTSGLTVDGEEEITVTNSEEITLDFSRADASVGRNKDGWWAGIKIIAPEGLTEDELKNATYKRYDANGWTDPISFWNAKDSKDADSVHYMGAWMCVTPELIENDADGMLTVKYQFDWYGNGFESEIQEVTFTLDTTKIYLNHENYYADVSGITQGLTVSGADTANTVVTNAEEITLDFSKADMSVGRYMDGWWAGVNILVPEELTEEDVKNVKYRRHSAEGWSEDRSFWQYKDSKEGADRHYITVWVPVTLEYIENDEDGFLTSKYLFDWDNNGFGISTQEITVKIDVNKLKLIHSEGCTKVIDKEAKAPECLTDGNTEASHCGVCGLVLSVEEVIPALGHTEGEAVTENDVKPDCENEGSYDTVVYCSVCDAELSRETTPIPALGHDYSEKIIDEKHLYQAKTCVSYAKYFYDCIRCDGMTSATFENKAEGLEPHEKIKKLDKLHLISPADCENKAKYHMGCKNCDTVFTETFTDGYPKYHLFTLEKVTKKAGVNKDGYTNFYCEDCGKADNDPIPFAGIKTVKLSGTSFSYTGKAITPSVTVKDSKGKTLKKGTDYTVKYSANKAPGTATATVTFTGKYTGTSTLKFTIKQLPATKKISFTSTTSTVKLTWEKVPNATGYKVYRKTSKGWTEAGSTTKNTLTVKKLSSGKRYTFMVKAYAKVNSKTYLSDASKSIYTVTKAKATSKLTATQTVTTVTLKWSKVSGADSYRVYKYNSKTKKYDFYKTVTGTKLTIKKLKSGTTYKYLVKAVTLTADKVKVTGESKKVTVSTKPTAVTINVTTKGGTATIKWKSVRGATGYRVYCMDSKTGKLEYIGTAKSGKTSFTKKGFTRGAKYLFAVRAYRTVNSKKLYGEYGQQIVTMK